MKTETTMELNEHTDYMLKSGETTGLLSYKPGSEQQIGICPDDDPQPWFSEKLGWWFGTDGTSGPGMEDHERRIIGVAVKPERDTIETPGGKLPYGGAK